MSSDGDGARFLVAFNRLKRLVEDEPARLEAEMDDDSPIVALCQEVYGLITRFEKLEVSSGSLVTKHVSVAAINARREYDERWRYYIWYAAHGRDMPLFVRTKDEAKRQMAKGSTKDETGFLIDRAKRSAEINADCIEEMIETVSLASSRFPEAEDDEIIEIGLPALKSLLDDLDVEGVFWRQDVLPHVLIPTHVANRYGEKKQSLYRRLNDAARAFVYGAPLAALAMQRAVLEEVLTEHWDAPRTNRGYQIRDVELPDLRWGSRADRLKNNANAVLHGDLPTMSPEELDRLIIDNFLQLRVFIENAPGDLQLHRGEKP